MYPIRIYRANNMEIWELRLVDAKEVFCYFSLVENTSEKYLAVDIHSNVDLQNYPNIDYEEIITSIECLYENMLLEIDTKISLHVHNINTEQIEIQDEKLYGSKARQIASYLGNEIKENCTKLVEKNMNLTLNKSSNQNNFCQNIQLEIVGTYKSLRNMDIY